MTRTLNYESYHDLHLYHYRDVLDGVQYLFKFYNHYGASVVKHKGSYGHENDNWELAVIHFDNDHDWDLVYYTDITDDVIGNLTDEEVNKLLERIQNLDELGHEEITIAETRRKEVDHETEQD